MTQQAVSLMDVLAPPGNDWLRELSRRKTGLPAGVHIVRFSEAEDDPAEDGEAAGTTARRQKMAA
ncbi:MAG: hypothetical protein Q8O34_10600 [Rhodocyclaceae bacterium]|nr:hypothetical protein [Rhodocyclaceae bacterium]